MGSKQLRSYSKFLVWEEEKQYYTTFSCEDSQMLNISCRVLSLNQFYLSFDSLFFFPKSNPHMTKSYERSRLAVDFTDCREDVRDALALVLSQ